MEHDVSEAQLTCLKVIMEGGFSLHVECRGPTTARVTAERIARTGVWSCERYLIPAAQLVAVHLIAKSEVPPDAPLVAEAMALGVDE